MVSLFRGQPSPAQDLGEKIRVKLEVVGDQNVDSEADKFMRKVIAVLRDIELVESDPQVYLHIITRRIVTNTGRRIGYVMAVASAEIMEMRLRDDSPFICSDYSGLWLETGPDLRGLCDKCISAVDYGVFARVRGGSKK